MLVTQGFGVGAITTGGWGGSGEVQDVAVTHLTPRIYRALELEPQLRAEDVSRVPWPAAVELRPSLDATPLDDGLGEADTATYGLASLGEGYVLPPAQIDSEASEGPLVDAEIASLVPDTAAVVVAPLVDAELTDDGLGESSIPTYGAASLGEGYVLPEPAVVTSVEPSPLVDAAEDDNAPTTEALELRPKLRG